MEGRLRQSPAPLAMLQASNRACGLVGRRVGEPARLRYPVGDFDDHALADLRALLRARYDAPSPLIELRASVARGEAILVDTGVVPAGRHPIDRRHGLDDPTGGPDLHVRVGATATLTEYDCRPYAWGSDEQ